MQRVRPSLSGGRASDDVQHVARSLQAQLHEFGDEIESIMDVVSQILTPEQEIEFARWVEENSSRVCPCPDA